MTEKEKQDKQTKQVYFPKFTFDDVLALQCCMETVKKVQEDKELYEKLNLIHSKIYDAYRIENQSEQASLQNNNNIDLTKILKDCPRGTKFYSYIFGDETYFQGFSLYEGKPISITIYGKKGEWQNFSLSRKGHPYSDECGECCIFPSKELRDWSKFTALGISKRRKRQRDLTQRHLMFLIKCWRGCTWERSLPILLVCLAMMNCVIFRLL